MTYEPWQLARLDLARTAGKTCGLKGGYQEQNPYDLSSPLFDAWREGWFLGIEESPANWGKPPRNIQQILNAEWKKTLARST